ncbi:MAG TPA: hypothetical protein DCF68_10335 [Cyanothece sp. UBA12306]|nr:hypothetical protein [Cyanothece sp. UBA12306]
MNKKSLSDLLRQEATENVEVTASDSEPTDTATTKADLPQKPISSSSLKRMTKAQLETKIKELMAALAIANQPVDALKSELEEQKTLVKTLQSDLAKTEQYQTELEEQKTLIKTLQSDLAKTEQYQTELEEQKQLVEKLYIQLQKNEEMAAQLEEQKQVIESLNAELGQAKQETKLDTKSQAMVLQKKQTLVSRPRSMGRYIAPPQTDKPLTNDDIGWFD